MTAEFDELLESLDRLQRHVIAIRAGSRTARDDLAVVLHILCGTGSGYGVVAKYLAALGIPEPQVPGWSTDIPGEIDGKPVMLAVRTRAVDTNVRVPLSDHYAQARLRFAVPGMEPAADWSLEEIVRKVRNKFGGHVDHAPPAWLRSLRYYPAADTDIMTFLLWSGAEEILTVVTEALNSHGVVIDPYRPSDHYLDGIEMTEGLILGTPGVHLDVRAGVACAKWTEDRRRAILGGMQRALHLRTTSRASAIAHWHTRHNSGAVGERFQNWPRSSDARNGTKSPGPPGSCEEEAEVTGMRTGPVPASTGRSHSPPGRGNRAYRVPGRARARRSLNAASRSSWLTSHHRSDDGAPKLSDVETGGEMGGRTFAEIATESELAPLELALGFVNLSNALLTALSAYSGRTPEGHPAADRTGSR